MSPAILVDAKRVKLNQLGHTHVWCRANSPKAKIAKRQICRSEFWSLCLVMILERKHAAIIWISLRWCTVLYSLSSRFNHFSSRINIKQPLLGCVISSIVYKCRKTSSDKCTKGPFSLTAPHLVYKNVLRNFCLHSTFAPYIFYTARSIFCIQLGLYFVYT